MSKSVALAAARTHRRAAAHYASMDMRTESVRASRTARHLTKIARRAGATMREVRESALWA